MQYLSFSIKKILISSKVDVTLAQSFSQKTLTQSFMDGETGRI